jgi:hypothetical protein
MTPEHEQYRRRKAEQEAKYESQFLERRFGWWRNPPDRFAALVAIFTGLLFAATAGLWIATKDLVQDARETSARQLRAYVGISTTAPIQMSREKITITVDNFGQTPAKNLKIFSSWEFIPYGKDLPPDFKFPDKPSCRSPDGQEMKPGSGPVWPKNPMPSSHLHCPDELDNLIKAERKELNGFFYGYIQYTDVFDQRRITTFCTLYNPFLGASVFCARHNEIDPDEKE